MAETDRIAKAYRELEATAGSRWDLSNRGNQLTGTVSSFSPYNLYLNNGLHVVLHNGTVINPTGTSLNAGQRVRVVGYRNADGTFAASEVDVIGNGNGSRYLR